MVGSGLAGLRTIEGLRRLGFAGTITWIGEEHELPYDRPPLSKQYLAGEWDDAKITFREEAGYEALRVDRRFGQRAVALHTAEREVLLESGRVVPFDALVIATGARVRRLPEGEALAGVHSLRTRRDAVALRAALCDAYEGRPPKVVLVGAGFIGLEVAATCRARGLEVTVLEALPRPLAHLIGYEAAGYVVGLHEAHGVAILGGANVAALDGEDRVRAVRLVDGRSIAADVVVVGIGVIPNVDWLRSSGLELDRGVLVDAHLRTNVPGIYAIGDVAQYPEPFLGQRVIVEHWTNAVDQATHVVSSILGKSPGPYASVPYFWSEQYDQKIQFAGRARPTDTFHLVDGSFEEGRWIAHYGREGRLVAALAVNHPGRFIKAKMAIAKGAEFVQPAT